MSQFIGRAYIKLNNKNLNKVIKELEAIGYEKLNPNSIRKELKDKYLIITNGKYTTWSSVMDNEKFIDCVSNITHFIEIAKIII